MSVGAPAVHTLVFPRLGMMLVSTLALTLLAAALGILQQIEPRRRLGRRWSARSAGVEDTCSGWSAEVNRLLPRSEESAHSGRAAGVSAAGSTSLAPV